MEKLLKRYYLEVLGCQKPEKYVVKAYNMVINSSIGYYEFQDEDLNRLSLYPINYTIIKSIEIIKSDNE